MRNIRSWHGVRMRQVEAYAEPDGPPRQVIVPAAWDDWAAAALAWLAPGDAPASLAQAADGWIGVIEAEARLAGMACPGAELHDLLRARRGAPGPGLWFGQPEPVPSFTLNLAAFHDPELGFDVPGFAAAVERAVCTLSLAAPAARRIAVAPSGLAGLLAALGLEYGGAAAATVAASIMALLRCVADAASARMRDVLDGPSEEAPALPAPPLFCAVPGLAAAAREAWMQRPRTGLRHEATTQVLPAGPVDALLGVETGGIAPAFSAIDAHGGLTRAAMAYLAANGLSAEAALAEMLAGRNRLQPADAAAHAAMRETVAAYIQALPDLPAALPAPVRAAAATPRRRDLPARTRGHAQRASIGGHTVFLRTAEYEDGTLGEICLTPQKESAAVRGLMESFAQAVSLGLQHGVPLAEYVEAFTLTRFGASGAVEGDPAVSRASSVLDYVFRNLAVHYLGRHDLPPAPVEEAPSAPPSATPLLPLDLPRGQRPRPARLRLVGQ